MSQDRHGVNEIHDYTVRMEDHETHGCGDLDSDIKTLEFLNQPKLHCTTLQDHGPWDHCCQVCLGCGRSKRYLLYSSPMPPCHEKVVQ